MWIKICGLTDETGVRAALDARADAIGFVFFPPSPRDVAFDVAGILARPARGKADVVALTVDADDALLDGIVEALAPDILQLHGTETPERVSAIRARFGLPVMKALPIFDASDLKAVETYSGIADRVLFDAKPPKDATRPGGNGEAFDWTLLGGIDPDLPYVLSGGLNAANVGDAVASLDRIGRPPFGLDVSSGVETGPGIKHPAKVRAFAQHAREAIRRNSDAVAV